MGVSTMELFCFCSESIEDIWVGIRRGRWAVSVTESPVALGRFTKGRHYFLPGSYGHFYCSETRSFTTPFKSTSEIEPKVESKIWVGSWMWPFHMRAFGDPDRQTPIDTAQAVWTMHTPRLRNCRSIATALNANGLAVFVPTEIAEETWEQMIGDLAIPQKYGFEL
jgi:hypothetical protein